MTTDVVIVGAGIMGSAVACELAREGLKVQLIERQRPAGEATWAAAGMLATTPEGPGMEPLVPLGRASLALYPDFVKQVEEESGMRVGFRQKGSLVVFLQPKAEEEKQAFLAALAKFELPGEPLAIEEARRREPGLGPAAGAAVWLPQEASIDNRALGRALALAASRRGVHVRNGVEVKSLLIESKSCRGVLADGEKILADRVVIAAGCFSGNIEHVAPYAPTRPARGQMAAIDAGAAMPGSVLRSMREHLVGYLVPREDGRLLAGSTMENAGFDKSQTPGGLRAILAAAVEMIPALETAPVIETWSGLRPDTPDHLPILGLTDMEGLSIATGHFRDGILLGPITARLARQWILGQPSDLPLEPFSPLRFVRRATAG